MIPWNAIATLQNHGEDIREETAAERDQPCTGLFIELSSMELRNFPLSSS